jgi:hypothetical protein
MLGNVIIHKFVTLEKKKHDRVESRWEGEERDAPQATNKGSDIFT